MKPYKDSSGYWHLPVVGVPDRADPLERLGVGRGRRIHPIGNDENIDHYAIVELHGVDPIHGTDLGCDDIGEESWPTVYFVFKRAKEAAPGDAVAVLHEHEITVRHYEPLENGFVCLRSAKQQCPTWIVQADEVNIQGIVVRWAIDWHDSGWA